MSRHSKGTSVFDEPHMKGGYFEPDKSEEVVSRKTATRKPLSDAEAVKMSIWDEPGLSVELTGKVPETALTYQKWFCRERDKTSNLKSWLITLFLILASGPWAVIGAFVLALQGLGGVGGTAIVVFGPVTEEVLKVAAALIVLEKRPFFFNSARQILVCCILSGFVFAYIENLLYLNIYIANPTPQLILWRWTVCVALHVSCSTIASLGLIKMWRKSMKELSPPKLFQILPYLITAAIIHGIYNNIALFLSPLFK